MNTLGMLGVSVVLTLAPPSAFAEAPPANTDTCLFCSAENIVSGEGNWYCYVEFSTQPYTFQKGDRLEYDILMPSSNPILQGGVDIDLAPDRLPPAPANHASVRDLGLLDGLGLKLHGDAVLKPAADKWYHRTFDLSVLAGCTAERWTVVFEGDAKGRYAQFLDNIRITRDGKTVLAVYEDGPAPVVQVWSSSGYSKAVVVGTVSRSEATDPAKLPAILARAQAEGKALQTQQQFRMEMELARRVARKAGDVKVLAQLDQAEKLEDRTAFTEGRFEAYLDSLKQARLTAPGAQPLIRQLTGHLIAHSHFDIQWEWTWDETINQILPDTLGQAVKFMEEFPDFKFSQSSAAVYLAIERYHPALFEKIKKYVAERRWELVGGRWCEGDENMASPESHARQVLYGQRYFQSRFGKTCTVGLEPDNFGHSWQMPQVLTKAGMDAYYFTRGGKDQPLFWWEGPDGSKILTVDENAPAGEHWDSNVIEDEKVREVVACAEVTGLKDHMMLYGVGNHGGGPTRENIQDGLAMKDRDWWPTIRFSTMTDFFRRAHEQAPRASIPTVKDELNPIFDGCYTTNARIKRGNRLAESLLESTEVWASLAAVQTSSPYPREALGSLWQDVLWNQFHDTLCGSCTHAPSLYSLQLYELILARGERLRTQALDTLAKHVPLSGAGPHVLVFNPLAWPRSEVVDVELIVPPDQVPITLQDDAGPVPTQVLSIENNGGTVHVKLCFLARDVYACGGKAFRPEKTAKADELARRDLPLQVTDVPGALPASAVAPKVPEPAIRSQFVVLHEKPGPPPVPGDLVGEMTGWVVGEIDGLTRLDQPAFEQVLEAGPVRWRVRRTYRFGDSTITEDTITYAHTPQVDFDTTVEWLWIGSEKAGCAMLKVAFPTGIAAETATAEVPFADIARQADGREYVTQKWCDVSDATRGFTILNDCKHGYDAKDGTLRLTLLRSSYHPDPVPDVGTHRMRYAAAPHAGPLDKLAAAHAGWAFNKPMSVVVREPGESAKGGAPKAASPSNFSGCGVTEGTIIVTALKQAEDDNSLILRAYECTGKPTKAKIELGFPIAGVTETDLIERDLKTTERASANGNTLRVEFTPYEIRTLRLEPQPK